MERYSKLVRNFFKAQVNINREFKEKAFPMLPKQDIEVIVAENLCHFISKMAVSNTNNENLREHVLYASFLAVQLFSDLYRNAIYYQKCCDNTTLVSIVNELLSTFSSVNNMEGISQILLNSKSGRLAYLATLEFDDLSVYNKVLRTKVLTIDDVEYLEKLNPFFEEEYNAFNVDINQEFLIRQIEKWQRVFKDDIDKSYNDAIDFLLEYRKIDSDSANNLISSLISEYGNDEINSNEKDKLKVALINFYTESKGKKLTK